MDLSQHEKARVPQVVIIGAGFGGLEAAKALANAPADVTVIDQYNHHCFQPLLYQVATAALSPADIAWPIRSVLRRQKNAEVVLARVTGIDRVGKRVITDTITAPYDYLVLATGATHFYFGHDEWEPFAPGLKYLTDALKIRGRILSAFERAEITNSEAERQRLMTFAIIGGGPTGVELAGATAEIATDTLRSDFRRIDPRKSRIVLLEAGPRILPAFPPELAEYAANALRRAGVEVRTSARVTSCDPDGVMLENERVETATAIWAAGVAASPAATWLSADHDRNGRVKVNPDLSVPGADGVFVIGDTAAVSDRYGKPVPGIAPAAKQMGQYIGRLIGAKLSGAPAPGPFVYRHYGNLATIGRKSAIVDFGRFRLTGLIAWIFWSVAHIYFLIGVRNRFIVAFIWFWNYLTAQRGARLITADPSVPQEPAQAP